jgi:CheY-like chemotaxis protein
VTCIAGLTLPELQRQARFAVNSSESKSLSVLVADDASQIHATVSACLEPFGHSIAYASTGRQAANLLQDIVFDLVITDVVMPDGDGLEVIQAAKRAQPGVRIIVMSGGGLYLQPADCIKMATTLGAHAAVAKPFKCGDLIAAIEAAMGAPADAK